MSANPEFQPLDDEASNSDEAFDTAPPPPAKKKIPFPKVRLSAARLGKLVSFGLPVAAIVVSGFAVSSVRRVKEEFGALTNQLNVMRNEMGRQRRIAELHAALEQRVAAVETALAETSAAAQRAAAQAVAQSAETQAAAPVEPPTAAPPPAPPVEAKAKPKAKAPSKRQPANKPAKKKRR